MCSHLGYQISASVSMEIKEQFWNVKSPARCRGMEDWLPTTWDVHAWLRVDSWHMQTPWTVMWLPLISEDTKFIRHFYKWWFRSVVSMASCWWVFLPRGLFPSALSQVRNGEIAGSHVIRTVCGDEWKGLVCLVLHDLLVCILLCLYIITI